MYDLKLTQNAVESICKGMLIENPILQVLGIDKCNDNSTNLLLSDGKFFLIGFLSRDMSNQLVEQNVTKNSIICVRQFSKDQSNRRIEISEFNNHISNEFEQQNNIQQIGDPIEYVQKEVDARIIKACKYTSIINIDEHLSDWKIAGCIIYKRLSSSKVNTSDESPLVYLKVIIKDKSSQIQGLFLNQCANRFYSELNEGKCYEITNGSVRKASRMTNLTDNTYEILFTEESSFTEICLDSKEIVNEEHNIVKLSDNEHKDGFDLLVAVTNVYESKKFTYLKVIDDNMFYSFIHIPHYIKIFDESCIRKIFLFKNLFNVDSRNKRYICYLKSSYFITDNLPECKTLRDIIDVQNFSTLPVKRVVEFPLISIERSTKTTAKLFDIIASIGGIFFGNKVVVYSEKHDSFVAKFNIEICDYSGSIILDIVDNGCIMLKQYFDINRDVILQYKARHNDFKELLREKFSSIQYKDFRFSIIKNQNSYQLNGIAEVDESSLLSLFEIIDSF